MADRIGTTNSHIYPAPYGPMVINRVTLRGYANAKIEIALVRTLKDFEKNKKKRNIYAAVSTITINHSFE